MAAPVKPPVKIQRKAPFEIGRRASDQPAPPSELRTVEPTGNTEVDDKHEAVNALAALKKSKDNWGDAGYFVQLVFPTAGQRDEFVEKSGWSEHMDSTLTYFDGMAIAEEMGHEVHKPSVRFPAPKADRGLVDEVGIIITAKKSRAKK